KEPGFNRNPLLTPERAATCQVVRIEATSAPGYGHVQDAGRADDGRPVDRLAHPHDAPAPSRLEVDRMHLAFSGADDDGTIQDQRRAGPERTAGVVLPCNLEWRLERDVSCIRTPAVTALGQPVIFRLDRCIR